MTDMTYDKERQDREDPSFLLELAVPRLLKQKVYFAPSG
jgi:hypothetical protein